MHMIVDTIFMCDIIFIDLRGIQYLLVRIFL